MVLEKFKEIVEFKFLYFISFTRNLRYEYKEFWVFMILCFIEVLIGIISAKIKSKVMKVVLFIFAILVSIVLGDVILCTYLPILMSLHQSIFLIINYCWGLFIALTVQAIFIIKRLSDEN